MSAALRRRYAHAAAKKWQRVEGGYEQRVQGRFEPLVYRVQRRKDLTDHQKWELDRRLGLQPRDGKVRKEWVVMINDNAFRHAYGKKEAIEEADKMLAELAATLEMDARRSRSGGASLGLGLVQSQTQAFRPREFDDDDEGSVVSRREDIKLLAYERYER